MNNEEKILFMLEAMQSSMTAMQSGITAMKADITAIQTEQMAMKIDLASVKADLAGVKADLADVKIDLEDVKQLVQKVAVTQEAVILPRLDLLAEGHTHLVETLAPKSRAEKLEDEVDFLKTVIKAHSREIEELKKAQ